MADKLGENLINAHDDGLVCFGFWSLAIVELPLRTACWTMTCIAGVTCWTFSRLLADIQFDRAIGYYVIQVTFLKPFKAHFSTMRFGSPPFFIHFDPLLPFFFRPAIGHYVIQVSWPSPICQFKRLTHYFDHFPLFNGHCLQRTTIHKTLIRNTRKLRA